MATCDEVLVRFDASAAAVFAWVCRLLRGDLHRAETLLTDTFVSLHGADPSEVECLERAYELVSVVPADDAQCDGIGSLALYQRAVLDLALVQRRSPDEICAIIGISVEDIGAVLDEAERAALEAGVYGSVAQALRANEHWLDDTARARTRDAITHVGRTPSASPSSSRRWITAAALAGAAVIATTAFWVIPDSSTSTSRPSTAVDGASAFSSPPPSFSTSISASSIPGYIATDLPSGFSFKQVGNYDAGSSYDHQAGYFELWAQSNATRTEGRWFAAVASNGGLSQSFRVGQVTQVVVHDNPALYTESADGITEIVWENPASLAGLDVLGHGYSAEEFVNIANSIQELATAPTSIHPDTELHFGGSFDPRAAGLNRIISTPTWSPEMANQPAPPSGRFAVYSLDTSANVAFSVTTSTGSQRAPASLVLQVHSFLLQRAVDLPPVAGRLSRHEPVQLLVSLGSPYFLGGSEETFRTIEWADAGDLITVTGNVSLSELMSAANGVQPATSTEWADLLDHPPNPDESGSSTVP